MERPTKKGLSGIEGIIHNLRGRPGYHFHPGLHFRFNPELSGVENKKSLGELRNQFLRYAVHDEKGNNLSVEYRANPELYGKDSETLAKAELLIYFLRYGKGRRRMPFHPTKRENKSWDQRRQRPQAAEALAADLHWADTVKQIISNLAVRLQISFPEDTEFKLDNPAVDTVAVQREAFVDTSTIDPPTTTEYFYKGRSHKPDSEFAQTVIKPIEEFQHHMVSQLEYFTEDTAFEEALEALEVAYATSSLPELMEEIKQGKVKL